MDPVALTTIMSSAAFGRVVKLLADRVAGRVEPESMEDQDTQSALVLELDDHSLLRLKEAVARLEGSDSEPLGAGLDRADPEVVVGGVALATDAQAVFDAVRRRIGVTFRVALAITVVLAALLVAGILGALGSAIAGNSGLALGGAGIALASLFGAYAYKPIDQLYAAVRKSQQLELANLMARQRLEECARQENPQERVRCGEQVWTDVMKALD
ncbi:MAG: hypothetical protein M3256_11105 [Actinomycetota bacterium]|nr:hypothetical protein [Actinomycetota bacterium]